MILENEKDKFLTILNEINTKRGKSLTIVELAEYLNVSESKMKMFIKGKIFDFWLLCRYGDLISININFWKSN